jgi:hypothetical protein
MHRADPDAGPAPYTVIGMYFIVPRHIQENDCTHMAELGTGAAVLAYIVIDEWTMGRDGILPTRWFKLMVRVFKMEQHRKKGILRGI